MSRDVPAKEVTITKRGPLDAFAEVAGDLPGAGTWWADARRAALDEFAKTGYPTTKHPEWKGTNVAPVTEVPFVLSRRPGRVAASDLDAYSFRDTAAVEVVFVDGHHVPELSTERALPKGMRVRTLARVLAEDADALRGRLGAEATPDRSPFTALNAAFAEDGLVVEVDDGAVVEKPVHLLFYATGRDDAKVAAVRNLVVAGENAQVTLIETFTGRGTYVTNAVTEVLAAPSAFVEHFKIQRESEQAFHVGTLQIAQERQSTLSSLVVTLGGAFTRNECNVRLAGEGSDSGYDGLFVAHDRQFMDHHLRVDHAAPRCASREVYKGILDDRARAVFDGRIIVRKPAQKTDAKQTNKNLLLTDEALVDSNPQLEIYADDVKCTHGSTTGQIDEEAWFYLRSRGIDKDAARSLLTYAFARQVTDRIRDPAVRTRVDDLVLERLPASEAVRDLLDLEGMLG